MSRSVLALTFCLVIGDRLLRADTTAEQAVAPATIQAPTDSAPARIVRGKEKLEAQLHAPAKLDFGGRQTVTIREVLDELRQEQHLSVRFDMPTLTGVLASCEAVMLPNVAVAAPVDESSETGKPDVTKKNEASEPASASSPNQTKPVESHEQTQRTESPPIAEILQHQIATLMETEVDLSTIDLTSVSVATVLRHSLDAVPTSLSIDEDFAGLPIEPTDAWHFDYVVEEDGLLVTTRLNALTLKETRVYSVKHLKEFSPKELANVIRLSVRPWSWQSQINDLGEQLKMACRQLPQESLSSLVKSGVSFTSSATGVSLASATASDSSDAKAADNHAPSSQSPSSDAGISSEDAATVIDLVTALGQAAISAAEIVHFADPPTGTIHTLPGKLIITQSQAAHREIAELLKQLGDD